MPWPGSPKSQQTPAINPPSMRYPHTLNEKSSMKDVADAVNTAFDGLTVHEQAFANLPGQIASQASTAATAAVATASETVVQVTGGVTAFNALQGNVIYFPSLGMVNDQLGEPLYLTQQSDNGAKIIVGDSTPVTVSLNQGMTAPWFAIIDNDSSAVAVLSADSGATVYGQTSIPANGFGIVFYDGVNFWAGVTGSGGSSGVTQIVAGSGITISPSGGTGVVTVNAPASGYSLGGTPTVAPGLGAGTGPTISVIGLDGSHQIQLLTGSAPAGSGASICTVSFSASRGHNVQPLFSPANPNAAALNGSGQVYIPAPSSATNYTLVANSALAASTLYLWNVSCP